MLCRCVARWDCWCSQTLGIVPTGSMPSSSITSSLTIARSRAGTTVSSNGVMQFAIRSTAQIIILVWSDREPMMNANSTSAQLLGWAENASFGDGSGFWRCTLSVYQLPSGVLLPERNQRLSLRALPYKPRNARKGVEAESMLKIGR